MKKVLAVLLLLALPVGAMAESLADRIGAPRHTTGQWYSNTGLTCITVDADVIVPDVSCVHTYAVSNRDVTAEDAKRMALAAAEETDWQTDWLRASDWTGEHDEPKVIQYDQRGETFCNYIYTLADASATVGSYNWHMRTSFGDKRLLAQTAYNRQSNYSINLYLTVELDLADDEALPGQSATLSESRAAAQAVAAAILPDLALERAAKTPSEDESGTYAYWFSFTRMIDGIPVTRTANSSLQDMEEARQQSYESAPKCEMLTCVVDQGRVVDAEWMNPWTVGEQLQQNVTLLPFQSVMDIFGTVSPLSIQHQEGDMEAQSLTYANTWQINEIRLGYMPVLIQDGGGKWELRPVWDFIGIRTSAFTYDDRPGNVALTIDAVDGSVIDRDYGY